VAWTAERKREQRLDERKQAIASLGGRCSACGYSDWRALQFDHINNDGHLERRSGVAGGVSRYVVRRILKGDDAGLQLLCANCHAIKTREAEDGQGERPSWQNGFGRFLAERAVDIKSGHVVE
jgi:5-methylcytosine-specific restriction endonuclease McrA